MPNEGDALAVARPAPGTAGPSLDQLRRFCTALLAVLEAPPAGTPFLPALSADLARLLGEGTQALTDDLRRELRLCEGAIEQLDLLTGSRYLDHGGRPSALRGELEQSREAITQVLSALEALQTPAASVCRESAGEAIPASAAPCLTYPLQDEQTDELIPIDPPLASEGDEPQPEPTATDEDALGGDADVSTVDTAVHAVSVTLAGRDGSAQEQRVRACVARAEQHRCGQQLDRARALYSEALRLDPQCRAAYIGRGAVQLQQGRAATAVEDFNSALALGPQDAGLYALRGDAQALVRDFDGAVADYQHALALHPGHVRARFNLAVAHRLRGESGKALAELARVLQDRPGHAPAYYNRGLVYLEAGLYDQAAVEFAAALVHNPDHVEAQQRLREATAAQQAAGSTGEETTPEPAGRAPPTEADENQLEVHCPICSEAQLVDWARLDRVITCNACGGSFGVRPDGATVEVARSQDGRWVEATKLRATRQQKRARRRALVGIVAAAVLLPGVVLLSWRVARGPAGPVDKELPRDLQPRAELFAQAWLRNDIPLMRRLTSPAYERILYSWYTRHRPPVAPGGTAGPMDAAHIETVSVTSRPPVTIVRLRITGLGVPIDLAHSWEERGGNWFFLPPPR